MAFTLIFRTEMGKKSLKFNLGGGGVGEAGWQRFVKIENVITSEPFITTT